MLDNERLLLLKNVKGKNVDVITFGDLSYIMNFIECDGFFSRTEIKAEKAKFVFL